MTKPEKFSPKLCFFYTVAAVVCAAITTPIPVQIGTLLFFGAMATFRERGLQSLRLTAIWTAPVAIPLLIVHGFVNPTFQVRSDFLFPIRPDGFDYAIVISLKLALFTLGIAVWRNVSRDRTFDAFVSWGFLPHAVLIVVTQGLALTKILADRSHAILLAQQARGMPVRKNLARKIASLPALVIPLVVHSLVDSDIRASALISRGLGSGPIRLARQEPPLSYGEWLFAGALLIVDSANIFASISMQVPAT